MKIGNFSCNVDACLQMGKDAFIEAHSHIEDVESVWKKIEKAGKKSKKLQAVDEPPLNPEADFPD